MDCYQGLALPTYRHTLELLGRNKVQVCIEFLDYVHALRIVSALYQRRRANLVALGVVVCETV